MEGTQYCLQFNRGNHTMTTYTCPPRWAMSLLLTFTMAVGVWGCSRVPLRYVWMAESDVTLTKLGTDHESYVGKTVILGGTIIEEQEYEQYLWLRLMNRPLDQDYVPHRPADSGSPEGGSYWVTVSKQNVSPNYQNWARVTVVGRVADMLRFKTEPVLLLLYMRGWDVNGKYHGIWENIDPQYVPIAPGSINMEK